MSRPVKWRKIENLPAMPYFIPATESPEEFQETTLKLEELEAVRLKDLEGLEQTECAEKMEVSRPTFQRILSAAREKIADCLVNGKTIRIEGGNFTKNICPVKCLDCNKEWPESFENIKAVKNGTYNCPSCASTAVTCNKSCRDKFCRKHCRKYCTT